VPSRDMRAARRNSSCVVGIRAVGIIASEGLAGPSNHCGAGHGKESIREGVLDIGIDGGSQKHEVRLKK
jgi:hypothetical protein